MRKYIWTTLHFAFALTLPVALLLLMSCKQAHEEHADLGPEFDPAQLDSVLGKATQGATMANLQENQMVHYEESIRVANQDPDILESQHDLKVTHRDFDQDTQQTRITVYHDANSRTDSGFREIITEGTIEVPGEAAANSGMLMSLGNDTTMAPADTSQPTRITYHNLQVSQGEVDAPAKAQAKPNCGGVGVSCKIPVTYLSYDEVRWSDDTHYSKRSYAFQLTSHLPYMSGLFGIMTTGCIGYYVPVKDKTYYVRDCQYLTDLQL